MSERRVVITGLGVVSCLGANLEATWKGIVTAKSGIGPVTAWDAKDYTVRFGGECRDFVPGDWMSSREERRIDRFAQFGVAGAEMALKDSGIDTDHEELNRIGCVMGSGVGGLSEIEKQQTELMNHGPHRVSPMLVPKIMANAAPGQISIRHGLRGPNWAVATACSSAAHAIGDALGVIRRGLADVMVTGGCEAAMTPLGFAGFCQIRALSSRNDSPETASRPFDRNRDGFVMAEGAGVLVLEELNHAKVRGAKIYAELVGFGMSADGCHITQPDPEATGPSSSMQIALDDAGCNPSDVNYINAHGTSTLLNDKTETLAIHKTFGSHSDKIAISSTKSQIGHALGASGGLELAITTYGMQKNVIPPTINYLTPDPECNLDYVPNEARDQPFDVALSNSFGFGGQNASLLIRKLS